MSLLLPISDPHRKYNIMHCGSQRKYYVHCPLHKFSSRSALPRVYFAIRVHYIIIIIIIIIIAYYFLRDPRILPSINFPRDPRYLPCNQRAKINEHSLARSPVFFEWRNRI